MTACCVKIKCERTVSQLEMRFLAYECEVTEKFKGVKCRVTDTGKCIAGQASTFSVCCFSRFLRSVFLSFTLYHLVLVILHMFHSVWMDPHKLAHVQLRSRQGTLSSECWRLAFFSNSTLHRCGSSFSSSHTT